METDQPVALALSSKLQRRKVNSVPYLHSQRLARIAAASHENQPDTAPVGIDFDHMYFYVPPQERLRRDPSICFAGNRLFVPKSFMVKLQWLRPQSY